MVYCLNCGKIIDEWDSGYYARQMLCIPCWDRKEVEGRKRPCGRCGVRTSPDSGSSFRGGFYCRACVRELEREREARTCHVCRRFVENWEKIFQSPDGKPVCERCHKSGLGKMGAKTCSRCGRAVEKAAAVEGERIYCESCAWVVGAGKKGLASRLLVAFATLAGD